MAENQRGDTPWKKLIKYYTAVVEDGDGNMVWLHLKSTNGKVVITHKEIEKEAKNIKDRTQYDTYYTVPTE